MFTVKEILKITNGSLICGNMNQEISKFNIDTRTINKEDIFVAIKGEMLDGNTYVEEALAKGVVGAIINYELTDKILKKYEDKVIIKVEDSIKALQELAKFKRNKYNIPVIAVTGSVGKTSTKDIIAKVLESKYNVLKTEGNLNNHIGLPLTLLKLENHTAIVVEMGMNNLGEIQTLTNIANPTMAVITNVGTSHIGILGSRENILKAKLEITEGLQLGGILFINNDNDLLNGWNKNNGNKAFHVKTFGINNESHFLGYNIETFEEESKVSINKSSIIVPVSGIHFIYNAICAYAIGKTLGIEDTEIVNSIKDLKLTKMRMQIEKTPKRNNNY